MEKDIFRISVDLPLVLYKQLKTAAAITSNTARSIIIEALDRHLDTIKIDSHALKDLVKNKENNEHIK